MSLSNFFQIGPLQEEVLRTLERAEKNGKAPRKLKKLGWDYNDLPGLGRAGYLEGECQKIIYAGLSDSYGRLDTKPRYLTQKGTHLLNYIRQFKKPLTTPANSVQEKNEMCCVCAKHAMYVPTYVIYCEYGGCTYDMSDSNGEALSLEWSRDLNDYVLIDPASDIPIWWRARLHICDCIEYPHLQSLPELVANVKKTKLTEPPLIKQREYM